MEGRRKKWIKGALAALLSGTVLVFMGCDGLLGGEFSQDIRMPGVYKEVNGEQKYMISSGTIDLYSCMEKIRTDPVTSPTRYTILLKNSENNVTPWNLTPLDEPNVYLSKGNFANKEITLEGGDTPVTLKPKKNDPDKEIPLLAIGTYNKNNEWRPNKGTVTVNLGKNIVLQGNEDNEYPLVHVLTGGVLNILPDSTITGNARKLTPDNVGGGGIEIREGGAVTMTGGIVSDNSITPADEPITDTIGIGGGGILVFEGGSFTMEGGEIRGNKVIHPQGSAFGGGICVLKSGSFLLKGGEITKNEVSSASKAAMGGGIYLDPESEFILEGGTVSKNKVAGSGTGNTKGGGVYVHKNYTRPEEVIISKNEPDDLTTLDDENNGGDEEGEDEGGEGDEDDGGDTDGEGDGDSASGDTDGTDDEGTDNGTGDNTGGGDENDIGGNGDTGDDEGGGDDEGSGVVPAVIPAAHNVGLRPVGAGF
jgi:hypothetical protein